MKRLLFLVGVVALLVSACARSAPDLTLEREVSVDGKIYRVITVTQLKSMLDSNDFLLVNVTTPEKVRLQRIVARNREQDPTTLAELRKKEALENKKDAHGQQLDSVAKMAKVTVVNDSTLEVLQQKVEQLVNDWMYKLQDARPDWDHYFMNIAEQVKMRCNCLSAKKGAIIVKDGKYLIAKRADYEKAFPGLWTVPGGKL